MAGIRLDPFVVIFLQTVPETVFARIQVIRRCKFERKIILVVIEHQFFCLKDGRFQR